RILKGSVKSRRSCVRLHKKQAKNDYAISTPHYLPIFRKLENIETVEKVYGVKPPTEKENTFWLIVKDSLKKNNMQLEERDD
ncbi:MAG: hypothetical protein SFH39_12535, partial [Candidatus Magnetobacterium sp. LHC-1]